MMGVYAVIDRWLPLINAGILVLNVVVFYQIGMPAWLLILALVGILVSVAVQLENELKRGVFA